MKRDRTAFTRMRSSTEPGTSKFDSWWGDKTYFVNDKIRIWSKIRSGVELNNNLIIRLVSFIKIMATDLFRPRSILVRDS